MKVFSHVSDRSRYEAGAVVIGCFDDRLWEMKLKFARQTYGRIDPVLIAGGIKDIVRGTEAEREFIFKQIQKSSELHATRRIVLIPHRDCGAYREFRLGCGRECEKGCRRDHERAFHDKELLDAKNIIRPVFENFLVESFFADFDGIHECRGPVTVNPGFIPLLAEV